MSASVNDDVQTPTDDLRARQNARSSSDATTGKVTKFYLEYSVDESSTVWRKSGMGFMDLEYALEMLAAAKKRASELESSVRKLSAPVRHVDWRLIQEITYRIVLVGG